MAHSIEFLLLRLLQWFLHSFPLPWVRTIARRIGLIVFSIIRYRRNVVLENIGAAYPHLAESDRVTIAARSYESAAVTLFEFLLFPWMDVTALQNRIRITNPELVSAALTEERGAIFLTAHYGSWELFAQAAGLSANRDGRLLMKVQSNGRVAEEIDRWRTQFGLRTSPSSVGLRDVLRTLRTGGWVVIAADQAAPKESVSVQFFGRAVPTYQGPAAFALQTGCAILLGVARREQDDSYSVTFHRIRYDDLDPASEESVRTLTERHVSMTEDLIRQDPGQWLWMHRRWKHAVPASSTP